MSWEWEGSVILIMSKTFSWPQRRLQMTGKGQDFIHRNRTPKENASLTFHVRDSLTFRVWSILRTASAAGKGVGCPTSCTTQRHFTRQNQHEQRTGRCFAARRPFNRTLARPLPPECHLVTPAFDKVCNSTGASHRTGESERTDSSITKFIST